MLLVLWLVETRAASNLVLVAGEIAWDVETPPKNILITDTLGVGLYVIMKLKYKIIRIISFQLTYLFWSNAFEFKC